MASVGAYRKIRSAVFAALHNLTRDLNERTFGTRPARRRQSSRAARIEALDTRLLLSAVTATPSGGHEIDLAITPDTSAYAMEVDRSTDGFSFSPIYTGAVITSYSDSGLSPDTSYYYQVTDTDGSGSYRSSANATTGPPAPSATAATNGSGEIDLNISTDSTATSVQISHSTDGYSYSQIYSGGIITSFQDTSLSANTNYYYLVTQSNGSGTSDAATASAKTAPPAPTVTAAANGTTKINLTLASDPSATSMQISRSTDGVTFTQIYSGAVANTYSDTGLTGNTTYYL